MKRSRGIIIGIGLCAALAVVCGLAFNSTLQTWAIRRLLAGQPAWGVRLDRVVIRPGTLEVTGLTLEQGALRARIPHLSARLSWWRLMTRSLVVDQLQAGDWELHYEPEPVVAATSGALPAAIATVPAAPPPRHRAVAGWIPHLFAAASEAVPTSSAGPAPPVPQTTLERWTALLDLPLPVRLGAVDLQGRATWRKAGPGADGDAQILVRGGELGPDRAGQFHVVVKAQADARANPNAALQSLDIDTRLTVQLAGPRAISRIESTSALVGRRLGGGDPEQYTLKLAMVMTEGRPTLGVELHNERKQLWGTELSPTADGASLAGKWNVAMSDQTLSSLMLGRPLPKFMLTGAGEVRSQFDLSDVAVEGRLEFSVDHLEAVRGELAAVGALQGSTTFAVQQMGSDLRCTVFDFDLSGAAPVAQVRLLQGVEVARGGEEFRVADPSAPVLAVDLVGMPSDWLQPWIDPWVVDSLPVHGRFVGLVTPHGLRVVTSDGLFIDGFVFAGNGRTLVDEVNVAISAGGEITQEGWQFEVDRLDVSDGTGLLASASMRGGRLIRENDVMKLVGHVETDLAALHRLPVLSQAVALASGRLEANFGVGLEDRLSIAATLGVSDLHTTDGVKLPDLQADSRFDLLADGAIEAHVPLRFSQEGRVSDLTFNVRAQPDATRVGWVAEGSLSGPRAFVADLQLLGLPFAVTGGGNEPVASPPEPNRGPSSGRPIWAGFSGTFKTAIGALTLPNGIVLQNVRGDLAVEADHLAVTGLHAEVEGGGAINLEGALGFDAEDAVPYSAAGHLQAEGVEMGPLLTALQSDRPPALEGKLNVLADLKSHVVSLDQIPAQAAVTAQVTSAGGILRALGVKVDQAVEVGKSASLLKGVLAAVSGNSRAQNLTQRLQTVTTVAQRLSAVAFDQLNLELSRGPQGDLELRDLSLISPALRVLGNGRITYAAGTPVWLQPVAITLRLAARDELAGYLQQLNLVRDEADSLGYRPMLQDLQLDGSLARLDTARIQRLLMKAAGLP